MAKLLNIYEPFSGHILMSFIGGVVIFLAIKSGKVEVTSIVFSIVMIAFCITLIPNFYLEKKIKKENKKKHTISMIVFSLILFFIFSGIPPLLSDTGMTFIGVRKSNVTVILQGNDLEMARHLTGNHNQSYFKSDALFTGVGTTSLLVINHRRMIVKNENLSLSF